MVRRKKRNKNIASRHHTAELLTKDQPFAYTEAYKALRTNLRFLAMGDKLKSIVVTSAIPGEGKTVFSINLAKTLADTGLKVLLVDTDLRNPSVHRFLGIRQSVAPGLSSLITDNTPIERSIGHLVEFKFDVILSGEIPPNPAELLGSRKMSEILKYLETKYDYIICDTPPVSVVTDAAELSQSADGVIMLVSQGMAAQQQVLNAKANLEKVGANILGAVLNNFDVSLSNQSATGDYNYHYYGR